MHFERDLRPFDVVFLNRSRSKCIQHTNTMETQGTCRYTLFTIFSIFQIRPNSPGIVSKLGLPVVLQAGLYGLCSIPKYMLNQYYPPPWCISQQLPIGCLDWMGSGVALTVGK